MRYVFITISLCLFAFVYLGNASKGYDRSDVISGGIDEQNPREPIYKLMAEESLQKHLENIGSTRHHKVLEVTKVTSQVVAGLMTRINFTAAATNCQDSNKQQSASNNDNACVVIDPANIIFCYSEIWEQPWLNKKEIKVSCSRNP